MNSVSWKDRAVVLDWRNRTKYHRVPSTRTRPRGDFTIQVGHEAALIDIDVIDANRPHGDRATTASIERVVSMLDNGSLNPGLYVVHINDGATVRSERLIVR
jgi:hypothetical protein